jgi:hypothetical protein
MSVEAGLTVMPGDDDLTLLPSNRQQFVEIATLVFLSLPEGSQIVDLQPVTETAVALYYTVSFHMGERFTSENTLANARSRIGWDFLASGVSGPIEVRGDLDLWEYQGAFRYNLSRSAFQPFVKVGYGLTWYRIEGVSVAGIPLPTPDSPWVRKPGFWENLWPNTLLLGGGIDWTGIRIRSAGVGVKAGYTLSRHGIGFERDAAVEVAPDLAKELAGQSFSTWRQEFTFQLTVSF